MPDRMKKVNSLIHKIVSEIIQKELSADTLEESHMLIITFLIWPVIN